MNTLLLDTAQWDLVLNVFGNIALAGDPYSLAQDAASAVRLFQGELWYNTQPGMPYWQSILGKSPPVALVRERVIVAAKTVPGVAGAECYITSFDGRTVHGQLKVTNEAGQTVTVSF